MLELGPEDEQQLVRPREQNVQNVPGRGLNAGRYGRSRESKGDPGVWCAREGGCSLRVRVCEHVYLCLASEPGGVRRLRRASGALGSPATPLWATPLCMYHGGGCAGRSGKGFRASPGLLALGIRGALWWHLQTQTPSL